MIPAHFMDKWEKAILIPIRNQKTDVLNGLACMCLFYRKRVFGFYDF